eukprot:g42957.t1
MNNTNQIQLNNTVYLILKDSQVDDAEQYACEIQDNGRTVHSVPIELTFSTCKYKVYFAFYGISFVVSIGFGAGGDSNFGLGPALKEGEQQVNGNKKDKGNASISKIQNRVILKQFDGMSFPLQIFPVQFEDAGTYTCTMDTMEAVKIKLITSQ